MQPQLQRLLVFFAVCVIFGIAVWTLEAGKSNPRVLLAALPPVTSATAGSSGSGSQSQSGTPLTGSNKQCPAESSTARYNSSKPKYPATYTEGQAQIQNLYGKPCYELLPDKFVQGSCDAAGRCKGEQYVGQDGKLHKVDNPNQDPGAPVEGGGEVGDYLKKSQEYRDAIAAAKESGDLERADVLTEEYERFRTAPLSSSFNKPLQLALKDTGSMTDAGGIAGSGVGDVKPINWTPMHAGAGDVPSADYTPHNNPIPGTGGAAPGSPAAGPATPPAPLGGAQSSGPPSATPSGSQSVTNTGGSTFSPSPQISSSPFSLGSLFGGGGSPSTGSGQAGSGGTIAYAPQGDPGFYNRNFQAVDAQVTFPKAQPSPQDILAYLAQNTKRVKADGFTAEELEDRGVVNTVILQAINNVVTPVGDFIRSFFTAEDVSKPTGEEVSAVAREEKPPLERGRLVLTLSADDSLVPGDPTTIANLVEWESRESIPESNRAWVESAPRAGEAIEGIAAAPPTYGWGEPPQIDGRSGARGASAPQVSDVSYNPFLLPGGLIPEIGEDEGASEPPRSFFSVMGKSFRTIIDAVGSLFANIGKALFWWL